MELASYLTILWRRKWVIAIATFVAVAVVALGTSVMPPSYKASTTLRLTSAEGGSLDFVNYDTDYADRVANTYKELATNPATLAELAQRLSLRQPPEVAVEIPANSELLQITVEHRDPVIAASTANTLADMLIAWDRDQSVQQSAALRDALGQQLAQVEEELTQAQDAYTALAAEATAEPVRLAAARQSLELKEQTYTALLEQYSRALATQALQADRISVIGVATPPSEPVEPRRALSLAVATFLGLVGATGLAFLFEHLDTTLHSTRQIERLSGLAALARVPNGSRWTRRRGPRIFASGSPQAEGIHRLRTNLLAIDRDRQLQTLLVTSALPNEGKSTVVANLAVASAQAGRRVILVDADLHTPSVHRTFGLPNGPGLVKVLYEEADLKDALQDTETPGLTVLAGGPRPLDAAELLASPVMAALVKRLRTQFDVVLLDTPSLLAFDDAAIVAPMVDGVIFVVARGKAKSGAVLDALDRLLYVNIRPLGLAVNRGEPDPTRQYYRRHQAETDADFQPAVVELRSQQ